LQQKFDHQDFRDAARLKRSLLHYTAEFCKPGRNGRPNAKRSGDGV